MLTGPDIYPRSGNHPKRIVILLHGLGVNGSNLIDIASVMNRFIPDTYFIAPNAPYSYDFGTNNTNEYQWFSRQSRTEEAAIDGLKKVESKINIFTDELLKKFNLKDENLAVLGFSQGTMVALHCFLRRPRPIAFIAGFSGSLIGANLLASEIKSKPPVALFHGEADNVLPIQCLFNATNTLKNLGVEVEAHAYKNLPHSIGKEGFEIAIDKFKKAFHIK